MRKRPGAGPGAPGRVHRGGVMASTWLRQCDFETASALAFLLPCWPRFCSDFVGLVPLMKIRLPAFIVCLVPLSPFAALAQGQLTPSGPPGLTFKTLQQIEPRTPISALPFPIVSPGSYYLTTNLTGIAGTNGITIAASDVTLDLSGFALGGVIGSQAGI